MPDLLSQVLVVAALAAVPVAVCALVFRSSARPVDAIRRILWLAAAVAALPAFALLTLYYLGLLIYPTVFVVAALLRARGHGARWTKMPLVALWCILTAAAIGAAGTDEGTSQQDAAVLAGFLGSLLAALLVSSKLGAMPARILFDVHLEDRTAPSV